MKESSQLYYGTKRTCAIQIQQAAAKAGQNERAFCDKVSQSFVVGATSYVPMI